jgi:Arc/MetJ-type ribon-helix-helix transcriptional regulator
MTRAKNKDEFIALRLPSEQRRDIEWLSSDFGYGNASEVIRRSLSLFADLHRLEILGVDVDTKLASAIEAEAVAKFNEAIRKFEALHRALDKIVQAIQGKESQNKQNTR